MRYAILAMSKVQGLRSRRGRNMDALAYDALVQVNAFPEVIPAPLRGEVWILGEHYELPQGKEPMFEDIKSRIWCTYRKNFRAIGGTTHTSDAGWGCTLRCGQMLLAQTLVCKHLGRGWRWKPRTSDPTYMKILEKFLDKRDSDYSIQMIAMQGADFGRSVGQWFGPNNVAQALKKLSEHDEWGGLAIHVAMDMVVVIEDIKRLCRQSWHPNTVPVAVETEESVYPDLLSHDPQRRPSSDSPSSSSPQLLRRYSSSSSKTGANVAPSPAQAIGEPSAPRYEILEAPMEDATPTPSHPYLPLDNGPLSPDMRVAGKGEYLDDQEGGVSSKSPWGEVAGLKTHMEESMDYMKLSFAVRSTVIDGGEGRGREESCVAGGNSRSLLLFIPLRLGQDTFNTEYTEALKACFTLPQSVGIIGGKPRHALYFIGYHNNNFLYLDPHTTQSTVQTSDSGTFSDKSYHCQGPDTMSIKDIDPSLALGFFCRDEADIDDLCRRLKTSVLSKMQYMFELVDKRPDFWGPHHISPNSSIKEPFLIVKADEGDEDSDGFELIDYPYPEMLPLPSHGSIQ